MTASVNEQTPLLGYTPEELSILLADEPAYRGGQIFHWIHNRGSDAFENMSNLPRDLRESLSRNFCITRMAVIREKRSRDGRTRKFLVKLEDDQKVEAVHMDFGSRQTVCVSTQVGCAVGCSFCATGRMGLIRNLTAGEIVGQIYLLRHQLKLEISNVVFMGMGEPFHNYEAVMKAVSILTADEGYGLSQRRITISTVGIIPGIERLSREILKPKLAVSLVSPREETRNRLVPINQRYPLRDLFAALARYAKTSRHRITFEYVLLQGVNDSPADARLVEEWLRPLPAKLNLIVYNPTGKDFQPSTKDTFKRFYEAFLKAPFPVTFRENMGTDIDAACGQLWTRNAS